MRREGRDPLGCIAKVAAPFGTGGSPGIPYERRGSWNISPLASVPVGVGPSSSRGQGRLPEALEKAPEQSMACT